MAWFYNFNFDEGKMYGMPIAELYNSYKNRRRIVINKEDDTIPRTTNPYVEGRVSYLVHAFPETVYKRCFWMLERNDEKAEEIKNGYLLARAEAKEASMCDYCQEQNGDLSKDIFFEWLPALFGVNTEDHTYNPDVTVYITDQSELKLTVMLGDEMIIKKMKKIKYCPFCGQKLKDIPVPKEVEE
jgi:hypothetical protein